ncbi:MAG: iron complex outermembrane receptor protein [Cyclobacteriaceae bacterium]|jgi:iron complex outermembrane receptor protein
MPQFTFSKSVVIGLLFCFQASVFAQLKDAKIEGQIVNQKDEPVAFSTLAFYKADSILVKGIVSDQNGDFIIENIGAGNYYLTVQNLEYENFHTDIISITFGEVKKLPVIRLTPNQVELSEVTVSASRQLVEILPDRIVFNVSSSVNASGNNGLELLRKAPGVIVDPDNNIILQGKSGVRIFINGRPSRLSGTDLATLLESMQSDNIELIELITNPSAKYEAEGNAGIINIKLKTNINLGYNGTLISNYSLGTEPRLSNGATINYGKGKLGITANATRFDNKFYEGFADNKIQSDYDLTLKSTDISTRTGYNMTSSVTYDFNDKHSVNFSGGAILTSGDDNLISTTKIIDTRDQAANELLSSKSLTDFQSANYNFNVNYMWNLSEDATWSTDASYGSFDKDNSIYQPNIYYDASGTTALREVNNQFDPDTHINLYSIKTDYEKTFEVFKLSIGGKYYKVETENQFIVSDVDNGNAIVNDLKSNTFNYTEEVFAAYLITDFTLFEDLKVSTGMRLEQTVSQGILESTLATENDNVNRNYFNYFPNMSLAYAKNKSEISLGYGKRITRPNYQDLNPFESKTSELVIWKGNPFLRPNYITNYQLTYSWNHTLVISNTYSVTEGFFARILEIVDETSTIIAPRNMRKSTTNGLSISYPLEVAKWWELSAFFVYNHSTFEGSFDNADISIKTDIYNARIQNTFNLPWDLTMSVSSYYNSPWIWRGSIVIEAFYGIDFGIKKDFFDDKLQVRLTGSDIFNTGSDFGYNGDYGGILIKGVYSGDNHRFGGGLTYKFGNQKIENRKRSGGLKDELDRISN